MSQDMHDGMLYDTFHIVQTPGGFNDRNKKTSYTATQL